MLNDVKKMIQEELPKGEASEAPDEQLQEACEMSEDMEMLTRLCDDHRITPTKELPPMRFLFTFNGTPCMPICELVAGTGKAKSGKTLFMSMIMACALDGEQLALKRIDSEPLTVLWFDTEQSEQSTQDILVNRIMPMAGITIRCQKEEAGGLTEEAVAYIDKDGKEFPFDDKFYVLNVRGIGWEKRKELLTFAIQRYQPDTQSRKTKQGATPKAVGTVAIAPEVKWEAFNHDYLIFHEKNSKAGKCPWEWNLAKLFREAFENHTQRPYAQVMGAALRLSKIQDKNYYYERYKEACRMGIIMEFKHPEKGDTWVELKTEGLPF